MLKAVIRNNMNIVREIDKYSKNLIYCSLAILIIMYVWRESIFLPNVLTIFSPIMRLIAYGLLGIKLVIDFVCKKFSLKFILISSIIGLFLILVSYQSKTISYFFLFLYIVASKDVDFNTIIKTLFYAHFISIIVIVLSCILGFTQDNIFNHYPRIRHSMGFTYATMLPNFLFYITLMFGYLKKNNFKWLELLVIFLVDIYAFIMTRTYSAFIFSMILVFAIIILRYVKPFRTYNKLYSFVAYFFPVFFSCFAILTTLLYGEFFAEILNKLNILVNGRLLLGKAAFERYGVSLFGRIIDFTRIGANGETLYGFVDSSFVRYLINFGVIFYILLMIILVYYAYLINKKKDIYMLLVFAVLMMHVTFDPQLLYIQYNPFLYILSYKNTVQLYKCS